MKKDKIYAEIKEYAREIKMPMVASCFEDEIREAEITNKPYLRISSWPAAERI